MTPKKKKKKTKHWPVCKRNEKGRERCQKFGASQCWKSGLFINPPKREIQLFEIWRFFILQLHGKGVCLTVSKGLHRFNIPSIKLREKKFVGKNAKKNAIWKWTVMKRVAHQTEWDEIDRGPLTFVTGEVLMRRRGPIFKCIGDWWCKQSLAHFSAPRFLRTYLLMSLVNL